MKLKAIATSALMASVALGPMSPLTAPARADGKDVVAGMIIGGIIGSAIANENNKKKSTKSTKAGSGTKKSGISAEERAANVEVQTALNYFGYPVGTADGSLGPKSRSAISEYQAFLGYPATGELSDRERTILVTSYHRAVAGGPVIASTVAGSVLGLKAVLIAQRDEMAGVVAAGQPASGVTEAAAPVVAAAVAPEPAPEVVAAAKEPALPSFISPAGANASLADTCSQVSLKTTENGALTTTETMQDANFALEEQFCLARTAAMTKGDALMAGISGFTPAEIAQQCAAFGPVLKDQVAALSLRPAEEVLAGVESFILSSGMSPAQLSGTAKVCLGVGYAQEDMEVAIGSALLLAAMGEKGYAEYLGHHLSQGFGAAERADLALAWYEMSVEAMGQGQLVVAPDLAGRDALIKKAAYTVTGNAAKLEPEAKIEEAALPVFEVAPEAIPEAAPAPVVVEEAAVAPPAAEEAPAEAVAEALAPVPETAPKAELGIAAAPKAAPLFVAPKLADVASAAPEGAAPIPAPADTAVVNAGAQAAMMAARLPFLIFSSF
jgi:peptidoglycan hydrolase-like protein with peptidoglycan-binding domain